MTEDLGARIRQARMARGLSLRATASEAAISPSLLSQVETGKVQPSVSTLYAIVNCLGLSVDDVLGSPSTAEGPRRRMRLDPVQRWEAAPEILMENGVSWRGLAVGGGDVDALHVTYQPGAASSLDGSHMRHEGVEYGFIIRGEITLKIDFESYVLRPGDSFCFDSMRPHLFRNDTDAVAEGVWFVIGQGRRSAAADERSDVMRSAVDVLDAMSRIPGRAED